MLRHLHACYDGPSPSCARTARCSPRSRPTTCSRWRLPQDLPGEARRGGDGQRRDQAREDAPLEAQGARVGAQAAARRVVARAAAADSQDARARADHAQVVQAAPRRRPHHGRRAAQGPDPRRLQRVHAGRGGRAALARDALEAHQPPKFAPLANFDAALRDGHVFAAVLLSHCPFLAPKRPAKPQPGDTPRAGSDSIALPAASQERRRQARQHGARAARPRDAWPAYSRRARGAR